MKKNNVDYDFQFRVRKYIEYCFIEDNQREKEEKITNKLSKAIKEEYNFQIFGKKILNIPFFASNFSKPCLKELAKIIHKVDFPPDETFIRVYIILWKQALVELLQFSFFIAVAVHGTAI